MKKKKCYAAFDCLRGLCQYLGLMMYDLIMVCHYIISYNGFRINKILFLICSTKYLSSIQVLLVCLFTFVVKARRDYF